MKVTLFWFLPTYGDGSYLGSPYRARKIDLDYLACIAKTAEKFGFDGALIPTGRSCEDSNIVASALIPHTKTFRFLVALRPGVVSPTSAARSAATLDRLSNGRAIFNLVAGGDNDDLRADGIWLNHDERYQQAMEFVEIWKGLLKGENVNYQGKYYNIANAKLFYPPLQIPAPELFFGGSSEIAHQLSGKFVDKYLSWGEPPLLLKEKIKNVKKYAQENGREISFGVRLHIIIRESKEEAWESARKLISKLDKKTIEQAQRDLKSYDSIGQQRMNTLYEKMDDNLEIYPNLWAGVGLVRGGAGTALVGDAKSILKTMQDYIDIGVDSFVLSGYPSLEELYQVGELLLPHLEVTQTRKNLREIEEKYDSVANRS